ncbi:XdhC family protein [Sphingomicrobium sp. XHP0235]|uniref:XdhC family protein n=1 Tax=Sphingomicrobium aquimarinum TaxID=3133971 RepID=UPI0031FE44D9
MTPACGEASAAYDSDHAALRAACERDAALATIVGIEGSFSRRLGAQLAVVRKDVIVGDLADTCLERQVAADLGSIEAPEVRRYGAGSGVIDFRLPCGGGLDILLDPAPDRDACRSALDQLGARRPTRLPLPPCSPLSHRAYLPSLRLRLFGAGPDALAVRDLAAALGIALEGKEIDSLSLGQPSGLAPADAFTAVLLLFHDHEWERALLAEALETDAFYIGAQGGEKARRERRRTLLSDGLDEEAISRIRSPVGVVPSSKTPRMLALSTLTEIVAEYESLLADA